jgi:hypothetical protein
MRPALSTFLVTPRLVVTVTEKALSSLEKEQEPPAKLVMGWQPGAAKMAHCVVVSASPQSETVGGGSVAPSSTAL